MDSNVLLQQLINGLVVGSVYALVALGYTMVYGIIGLINFAHGDVLMIGALSAYSVLVTLLGWGIPGWLALLISLALSMLLCMLLGYSIERVAYRRLRQAPRLAPLITAIGVSIVLQTVAMVVWGRGYHTFPQILPTKPFHPLPELSITLTQLLILLTSTLIMLGLMLLVNYTRLGRAMRATAENNRVAGLMGINVNAIISLAFLIGSALAAIAGVMIASNYGVAHYSMGFMPGLKAFTAAVLGGIGNLPGAMLGGILLGLIESLGAGYIEDWTFGVLNSSYQDIFAFVMLITVLVFRPSGLLGERIADRS